MVSACLQARARPTPGNGSHRGLFLVDCFGLPGSLPNLGEAYRISPEHRGADDENAIISSNNVADPVALQRRTGPARRAGRSSIWISITTWTWRTLAPFRPLAGDVIGANDAIGVGP